MSDLRGFFNYKEQPTTVKVKKRKKKRKTRSSRGVDWKLLFVKRYFRLNEFASNYSICLCIHNETGWDIPGKQSELLPFIYRFQEKIKRSNLRVSNKKQPDKDFYNSKQWKELRYIALKMTNGTCELCGATAHDGVQIHVDHIKPRSKYPELELDLDNLQVLCSDCNYGKSNYDETDYRHKM